jgi:hypothetical protein
VRQVLRIRRRWFENRGRGRGWMCQRILPWSWRMNGLLNIDKSKSARNKRT